jgi:hypothetical protein
MPKKFENGEVSLTRTKEIIFKFVEPVQFSGVLLQLQKNPSVSIQPSLEGSRVGSPLVNNSWLMLLHLLINVLITF